MENLKYGDRVRTRTKGWGTIVAVEDRGIVLRSYWDESDINQLLKPIEEDGRAFIQWGRIGLKMDEIDPRVAHMYTKDTLFFAAGDLVDPDEVFKDEWDTPFEEVDFYQWLDSQIDHIEITNHRLKCFKAYLAHRGIPDKIKAGDVEFLRAVHSHWFYDRRARRSAIDEEFKALNVNDEKGI